MTELEKMEVKEEDLELLEEVTGGIDMSISSNTRFYIRDLQKNKVYGPYSKNEVFERFRIFKSMGGVGRIERGVGR